MAIWKEGARVYVAGVNLVDLQAPLPGGRTLASAKDFVFAV